MEKFISFEKLSKKKKKELNSKKRKSWNGASPVTKKNENKKRYNRKKSHFRDDDFESGIFYFTFLRFSYEALSCPQPHHI
ncbi:MAG TPA: hypothetical protein DCR23_04690 [Ruminococcaceae bacterium]|nr:hypothetical protein [Oscillospiraceae bacterium]